MAEGKELTALVVDDDPGVVEVLSMCLGRKGVKVGHAETTAKGLEKLANTYYDLVFIDLNQEPTGVEVYKDADSKGMRAYIITGGTTPELMDEAKKVAGNYLISKPFQLKEIYDAIEEAEKK